MSTESGIESTDATAWNGLPKIIDIVTRVFRTGALIQLLTECDATTQLLLTTEKHQPGALKELFSHLQDNKYYELTVTWMAFSYTSAYVAKLDDLISKKAPGTPEELAAQAREAALKDVVAKRDYLRIQYFNDDNPGVLFAGADKLVKERFKVPVIKGVARPAIGVAHNDVVDLNNRLQGATWQNITDAEWLSLCGPSYRVLRVHLAGQDLGLEHKAVMEAEALLDPNFIQKTTQRGRVILSDGTSRLQKTGTFIQLVVNLSYAIDGDKCEYDTANMGTSLAGDAHWQDKAADWRLGTGENRKTYYSQVHPKIAQYVLSLLPVTPTPDNVTILDIAGDNGDLAERIIKEMAAAEFPGVLIYILVDYSEVDVAVAKRRFENMRLPSEFKVKTFALTRDMLKYKYDAARALKDFGIADGADIIINSGGLLNNQIGNDNQTPSHFNQMYGQMLKPGGYGVYSGLTPLLVNAATHRSQGLTVINLYDPEAQRQLHVVQRPK